ncbi:MAG: amidohydrolase [Lachnospiraceae bacterium]
MKMSKQELKDRALKAIDENREKIIAVGDSIFAEPELGYKEFKTAEKIKDVFRELGISYRDEVAITGVVGSLSGKSKNLRLAVMGELDAVVSPGHRCAAPDTGAAHACGHNCQIASMLGVAYALAGTGIMETLDGDVELMAVPAEEFVELEYRNGLKKQGKIFFIGGKQEFIRIGEFDDIDIMIMQHSGITGDDGTVACAGYSSNGFVGKMIQYIGKAAHAGGAPHLGINALNAASIGLTAVSYQRETFQDKDNIRVHPIITKGGDLVNVVPDDVRIETYIRGNNKDAILDADFKVTRAFQAGGDAVGAKTVFTDFPGYLPINMCYPLMDVMYENIKSVVGESNCVNATVPMTGSTDAGDVSCILPVIHAGFGGITGTLHSSEVEITDKEIAYIAAAKCMVMTVIDLLYDGAEVGKEIKAGYQAPMTKEEYLRDWGKLTR